MRSIRGRHATFAQVILLACVLVLHARAAIAVDAPSASAVRDRAGIFSASAIAKADADVARIRDRHHAEPLVATFSAVPDQRAEEFKGKPKDQFYRDWARQIGKEARIQGVVVLIVMDTHQLEIVVGAETEKKLFTLDDRRELQAKLSRTLKEGKYDDALLGAVEFIGKKMDDNEPAAPTRAPATAPLVTAPTPTPAQPARGAVAVVDLDKVVDGLGWQANIARDGSAGRAQAEAELGSYRKRLDEALAARRQEIADNARLTPDQTNRLRRAATADDLTGLPLSDADRRDFSAASRDRDRLWRAALGAYTDEAGAYRAELARVYRDALKPAVAKAAVAGGFTLVQTRQESLVYVDPSVDLTDKVIDAAKGIAAPAAPPIPGLKLPAPDLRPPPVTAPSPAPTSKPTQGDFGTDAPR